MPKKKDLKKQISSSNCSKSSIKSENKRAPKQIKSKSQRLVACSETISKSKQLSQKAKIKSNKRTSKPKLGQSKSNENGPRLCGNGKPMPSLEELEKMFEDSDEEEPTQNKKTKPEENTSQEDNNNNEVADNTVCITPKKENFNEMENSNLNSPNTIKSMVFNLIYSLTGNNSSQPIKPPKKRKKPLQPYIVGCENRPYVPSNPNTKFCKGDDNYGIDSNSSDDEELPTKRAKRTKRANISKSLFNAKSDEISARLKAFDSLGDKSSDSDKTVSYDVPCSAWPQSFSPEPSSSKCYSIIKKNEMSLNESLVAAQSKEDKIEILNLAQPCKLEALSASESCGNKSDSIIVPESNEDEVVTVTQSTIDDSFTAAQPYEDSEIEIVEQPVDIIVVEDCAESRNNKNIEENRLCKFGIHEIDYSDDCIEIIQNTQKNCVSPIVVDDYYNTLDLNETSQEDVVIVDIDDVIAESTAIVEKYRKTKNHNTITLAEPSLLLSSATVTADAVPVPKADQNDNNLLVTTNKSNGNDSACTVPEVNNPENVLRQFVSLYGKNFVQNMLDDTIKQKGNETQSQQESIQNNNGDTHQSLGECPICMDSFSKKTVVSTICGHIFCMSCIQNSLKCNGKKCPKCRKTLKKNGYHQIFL